MSIERVGDFRDTDFAVAFMLRELSGYLQRGGYLSKRDGNDVYLLAMLQAAADYSDIFRRKGYTFGDIRYCNHKRNKRGRLESVEAFFTNTKGGDYCNGGDCERHRLGAEPCAGCPYCDAEGNI